MRVIVVAAGVAPERVREHRGMVSARSAATESGRATPAGDTRPSHRESSKRVSGPLPAAAEGSKGTRETRAVRTQIQVSVFPAAMGLAPAAQPRCLGSLRPTHGLPPWATPAQVPLRQLQIFSCLPGSSKIAS